MALVGLRIISDWFACLLERASEHLNSVMRTGGKFVMGIT